MRSTRFPSAWWLLLILPLSLVFWLWAFGAFAAEPERTANVPLTATEAQVMTNLLLLATKDRQSDIGVAEAAVVLTKKIKAAFDAPESPKTETPK